MKNDALQIKVRLRKKAKTLYPNDIDKQRAFIDNVMAKIGLKKSDTLKESRKMVAQAFKSDG